MSVSCPHIHRHAPIYPCLAPLRHPRILSAPKLSFPHPCPHHHPSSRYIYSVYWALTTLTTVGYGDITPTNDAERVYTLIALLIGALVFGYLMTSVGDLVANLDNRANMVNEKLDNIQELILHHRLPPSLATRVRS